MCLSFDDVSHHSIDLIGGIVVDFEVELELLAGGKELLWHVHL